MATSVDGKTFTSRADVILPASFHVISDQGEMIKTPKGMWMKMNGSWMAMPANMAQMMQQPIDQGLSNGFKGVTNLACNKDVAYKGGSYDQYEFDSKGSFGGITSSAHVTLYADPARSLPVWINVAGKAMGKASTTLQHITFDPSIKIVPPK